MMRTLTTRTMRLLTRNEPGRKDKGGHMDFYGKTNRDYVLINTITFRLKNGKEVTIDREYTGYDIDEDGNFGMTWRGCYFWDDKHDDPNNPAYLTEEDIRELAEAELVEVYLDEDIDEEDEDADGEYVVTIESWD